MTIKFVDLAKQWEPLIPQVMKEIEEDARAGNFVMGKRIKRLEEALKAYVGVEHAIACNNGTSALQLALMGLGIGPGDEVILPANTFIATYFAVRHVGATPILVDCDDYYNIDPGDVLFVITPKTKAIIAVHLYGQCARMEELQKIADDYNLYLIEDAAQALGAEQNGKKAGSFGIAGCTSFYPAKNLGTWGEGGAVFTSDGTLNKRIRRILDQGQKEKYLHTELGHNMRLPALLSIPLYYGLQKLDEWNEARRSIANIYNAAFGVQAPPVLDGNKHIYHLYELHTRDRPKTMEFLSKNNIPHGLHYPKTIAQQPVFVKDKGQLDYYYKNAEDAAAHLLSLPIHPCMTEDEADEVVDVILSV